MNLDGTFAISDFRLCSHQQSYSRQDDACKIEQEIELLLS